MQRFGIGEKEMGLARLLWQYEEISSGAVVKLCKEEFNWAKSTTYTMLRRVQEHGLFKNEKSMVTPVMTEAEYLARVAGEMIDDKFDGSLAQFVKHALMVKKLSVAEKDELLRMLNIR